jgi:hypothetical protein
VQNSAKTIQCVETKQWSSYKTLSKSILLRFKQMGEDEKQAPSKC